jgi:hypothetical protein
MKFQIRCLLDKSGCGTYLYVEASSKEEVKNKASETANQWLDKQRENWKYRFESNFSKFRPPRSLKVVEWDSVNQRTVKMVLNLHLN